MKLTQTQELLLYGLKLSNLPLETAEGIFFSMETEDQQVLMIYYLQTHPKATDQEILRAMMSIIQKTKTK